MTGSFVRLAATIIIGKSLIAQPVQKHIDFDAVIAVAQERAGKAPNQPTKQLPEELRGDKLNYDTYREIRFRHEKALWAKEELPFRLEFFHPGYLYQTPVLLHEFTATHFQPIRFVQDFFDYGKLALPKKIPAETGYAGFKVLYRLNSADRWDELASFLGASYFRCLGKEQRYGQSARGLAINSGEPDREEEFPQFTTWWLGKPEKENKTLRLYGLLESTRCVGAYDFLIHPGDNTVVDVEAVLFFRSQPTGGSTNELKTVGIAPLTSMFWFGENSESKADDYRPEVHDSDGLLIRLENENLLWRPLRNPSALQHQTFEAKNPKGFGLLQRDRQPSSYQDLFNFYHRVPSVWIEPRSNWGDGAVHLVELPTRFEGADNIVTFWDPAVKPQPMQPYRVGYTLHWANEPDAKFPLERVVQTRVGADSRDATKRQFVVDFAGKNDPQADQSPPSVYLECPIAAPSDTQIFKNELCHGWRVFFSTKPDMHKNEPVDIQCSLKRGEKVISETWRYLWNPPPTQQSTK